MALGVRAVIIEDLLVWPDRRSLAAMPEADALAEVDALLEAALLDVRFDATTSSAWLLFDCRGAVQLEMGNTAVVVVRGVTGLQWHADPRPGRVWRAVMGWQPVSGAGLFSCTVELSPGSRLEVSGVAAEFYVGDIPGGDDAPPNFMTASDKEIRAGLAAWSSDFEVVHASFTDD